MADTLSDVLTDLDAESRELDALVTGLSAAQWATATPAAGWTIAHQIAHLLSTDEWATRAATDPEAFAEVLTGAARDPDTFVDAAAESVAASQEPEPLLRSWRTHRVALADALRDLPAGTKMPWFGPPMSATSMATARLMETWAHGLDVADALDVTRPPSDRLRNIAHIAVRTRDFAFQGRGLQPPADPFRVELSAPSGAVWTWGPADAAQHVTGSALDFCLLATRRRHRDDLAVVAVGPDAERWLDIAQAFAGPPGAGRSPLGAGATS